MYNSGLLESNSYLFCAAPLISFFWLQTVHRNNPRNIGDNNSNKNLHNIGHSTTDSVHSCSIGNTFCECSNNSKSSLAMGCE